LLQELVAGTNEIAIIGRDLTALHRELLGKYVPNRVLMASEKADSTFPLLVEKPVKNAPVIYLCRDYACLNPVFSAKDLISLIDSSQKR